MRDRQQENQIAYLRKKLKDSGTEEKTKTIKDIEMKDRLAYWRYWGLKAYRDKELGELFST